MRAYSVLEKKIRQIVLARKAHRYEEKLIHEKLFSENKQLLAQLKLLQYQTEQLEHCRQACLKEKEFDTILDLLECGNLEETIAYLSSNCKEAVRENKSLDDLHPVFSIVLSHQQNVANQSGIDFKYDIRAEELGLQNTDITILFSNILENAIEAAKCSNVSNPFVELSVIRRNGRVYIHCENSMDSNMEMPWWIRGQYELGETVIHQVLGNYHGQAVTRTKEHLEIFDATYKCMKREEIRGEFHAEYYNCG